MKVKPSVGGKVLANDTYEVFDGEVSRRIPLAAPGIDDYPNELLWSPERPTLIDVEIQLEQPSAGYS
jgi:hypothetical protein